MPRTARRAPAGVIFHVPNRGVGRRQLFNDGGEYAAFERCIAHAQSAVPGVDLLAYCLMPNHWHLVLQPWADDALGRFMHRLTGTHTRRWQGHRAAVGDGHLYQGRFKSFPVQADGHFLTVARYVERNPLRARLVTAAHLWPWSSLGRRAGTPAGDGDDPATLARPPLVMMPWPVDRPADWASFVDLPQTDAELAAVRRSIDKGRPFGDDPWRQVTVARLGLTASERPAGRPRRVKA
jgi:putative transposase